MKLVKYLEVESKESAGTSISLTTLSPNSQRIAKRSQLFILTILDEHKILKHELQYFKTYSDDACNVCMQKYLS